MKQELVLKKFVLADKKVQDLIKKLNKLHNEYQFKAYIILKEILKLRKTQMKNYTINSLANERGIKMNKGTLKYLFGFDYMTKNSERLINEAKLTAGAYLTIVRRGADLRKPKIQNEVVNKFVEGKLTFPQISHLPTKVLISKRIDRFKRENVMIGERIINRLRCIRKEIKANRKILKQPNLNRQIVNSTKKLVKVVNKLKTTR